MSEIGPEAVFLDQGERHRAKDALGTFNHLTAAEAGQVMVMAFLGVVIDGLSAGFTLEDAMGLLQSFQCAVNGGLVNPRHSPLHLFNYFFRSKVGMGLVDDIRNELPLESKPKPLLF